MKNESYKVIEKEEIQIIENMINSAVSRAIDDKFEPINDDIKEIRNVLIGDGKFYVGGMKQEHDVMYKQFEINCGKEMYTKVDSIIEWFSSIRLMTKIIGIGSVASVLAFSSSIIAILKSFGII